MSAPKPSPGSHPKAKRPRRIWAFAGGKGGVGRSFLAANLALQLARAGHRVALIDADFDGPTLGAFLGHSDGGAGLRRLFLDRSATLGDCLQRIAGGALWFAAGMEGPIRGVPSAVDRLELGLPEIEADTVILDLGSTRTPSVQRLFRAADQGIVVVTPEPLTLTCAHGYLAQLLGRDAAAGNGDGAARDCPPLGIVVNRARTDRDAFAAAALRSGFRKLLRTGAVGLGIVPEDKAVGQALARSRPLSLQYPNSPAAGAVAVLLERLESRPAIEAAEGRARPVPLGESDHYDILEVPRHATSRQIQSAYEDLKKIYRADSPYLPASVAAGFLEEIRQRVEQAYRTLIFLETRREYDRTLLAPGAAPSNGDRRTAALPVPAAPEGAIPPPPEEGITGEYLARVRRHRTVSLDTICEVTKIRKVHLQCIESDDFAGLPAPVFLRGFLRAYAQCLDLDADEICRDFMNRYQAWEKSREAASVPSIPDDL